MRITDIKLDPNITQKSPSGKEFRVTGVGIDLTKPPKWFKEGKANVEHFYWNVDVLIENKKRIQFTFDYYGELKDKKEI